MKPRSLYSLGLFGFCAAQSNLTSCGEGNEQFRNDCLEENQPVAGQDSVVNIAVFLPVDTYPWIPLIINHTVELINNGTDGWHDEIQADGRIIVKLRIVDTNCEEHLATKAYYDTYKQISLNGMIAEWCSGATIAIQRMAGLDDVAQVSGTATNNALSDKKKFPTFARTTAPDNENGEVGATVALLKSFGWTSLHFIRTDTAFAAGFEQEFKRLWGDKGGEIRFSGIVNTLDSENIDKESAASVLRSIPVGSASASTRAIVLPVHVKHAQQIIAVAKEIEFQPLTTWIGASWVAREGLDLGGDYGYIGVTPLQNEDVVFQDYLSRYQKFQLRNGVPKDEVWEAFPNYGVYNIIDAMVLLTSAISLLRPGDRAKGHKIVEEMRSISFDGVSGHVELSDNLDRANAKFSVWSYNSKKAGWENAGTIGTDESTKNFEVRDICFNKDFCIGDEIPLVTDDEPVDLWILIVFPVIGLVFVVLMLAYWRNLIHAKRIRQALARIQQRIADLRTRAADDALEDIDSIMKDLESQRNVLINELAEYQRWPAEWNELAADQILIEVTPHDDQYWQVNSKLQQSMPDAHISKLWRVQNKNLWTYYSFHKHRLEMTGISPNEVHAFHGTSNIDPRVIYSNPQDGFLMNLAAASGYWGRTTAANSDGRGRGENDENEMFLTKLVVGSAIDMDRNRSTEAAEICNALLIPPFQDEARGLRFNTVTGTSPGTDPSKIWVVYENGRGYPDFLIRYYVSDSIDRERTPFANRGEMQRRQRNRQNNRAHNEAPNQAAADPSPNQEPNQKPEWQYQTGDYWDPCDAESQPALERHFAEYQRDNARNVVELVMGGRRYRVDFAESTQQNIEDANQTTRAIRRVLEDPVDNEGRGNV